MDTALTDGVYFVEEDEGAGDYRHSLTLKVEDGAITSVVWDSKMKMESIKAIFLQ